MNNLKKKLDGIIRDYYSETEKELVLYKEKESNMNEIISMFPFVKQLKSEIEILKRRIKEFEKIENVNLEIKELNIKKQKWERGLCLDDYELDGEEEEEQEEEDESDNEDIFSAMNANSISSNEN